MSDNVKALERPRPPALPATADEMLKRRNIKSNVSLNDEVEKIFLVLIEESERFRALLEAVWPSDAVEGSLGYDTVMAAEMIREYARDKAHKNDFVANRPGNSVKKSLLVVMRRYEIDRKTRAMKVGGYLITS